MDAEFKKNLGSSLTAASLATLGVSATLTPLGVSKGVLIAVAVSGGVLGVAGVFFAHLFKNDQQAKIAEGAAIDAGKIPNATITLTTSEKPATPPQGSLVGTLTAPATVPTVKTP